MEISIESVFLFACALFVLHFIISGCGYTNVEGYRCGFCPISTAKCPPECPATATEKCGVWGTRWATSGADYECTCTGANANFADGAPVCLDTGSETNLNIGILDLTVDYSTHYAKKYKYEKISPDNPQSVWKEYTRVSRPGAVGIHAPWSDDGIVNDNDKLLVLNKLHQAPYYIQNIGIWQVDRTPGEGGSLSKTLRGVGVKTWNNTDGKHFYFSDRTGDAYCLSVERLSGGDSEEFPHKVSFDSNDPHIQYLGYKKSSVPFC